MIGERFEHNGRTYEVWHTEPIDGSQYPNVHAALTETGREPTLYYAAKVLASGKLAAYQCEVFYRFAKSRRFTFVRRI